MERTKPFGFEVIIARILAIFLAGILIPIVLLSLPIIFIGKSIYRIVRLTVLEVLADDDIATYDAIGCVTVYIVLTVAALLVVLFHFLPPN